MQKSTIKFDDFPKNLQKKIKIKTAFNRQLIRVTSRIESLQNQSLCAIYSLFAIQLNFASFSAVECLSVSRILRVKLYTILSQILDQVYMYTQSLRRFIYEMRIAQNAKEKLFLTYFNLMEPILNRAHFYASPINNNGQKKSDSINLKHPEYT